MTPANYPSLADRIVLITGGASGIGADMVRAFAANGAKVVFFDLQDDVGEALAAEIGATAAHRPVYRHCDVCDIAALQATIAEIRQSVGPVAVLINNAANDTRHVIAEVTPDYWDSTQNVNLRHHFFAAQAVHPHMRDLGHGSIINFSSITWRMGADTMVAYATAKGGVLALTHALARNFGADNIRVNAIEPGAIITERQKRLWFKDQKAIDDVVAKQMIGKMLVGDDVARLALFLAADDSSMITRQCITIDAGLV